MVVIEYLELSWGASIHKYKGENDYSDWWDFHGVGKEGIIPDDLIDSKTKIEDPENFRQTYALEFTPLYELADFEIKIAENIVIEDFCDKKYERKYIDLVKTDYSC